MGFVITVLAICIIVLYLLSNSDSSIASSRFDPSKSITERKHDELVTISNRHEKGKEKEKKNEMAKARKYFGAKKRGAGTTIRNVAGSVKRPLDWFVVDRAQNQISEAEKLIVAELNKYKVDWYREVAFEGLKFTEYGYARYDFLILTPKGIHMIEYDGQSSHCTPQQKEKDTLKDKFCNNNGIPLTRYNKQHYYHLEREIALLMADYCIQKNFF
jgi:hypothetical protein